MKQFIISKQSMVMVFNYHANCFKQQPLKLFIKLTGFKETRIQAYIQCIIWENIYTN